MKVKYYNFNRKPLEGKFFNLILNGEIIAQGRILSKAEDYYLTFFYNLSTGAEEKQILIKIEDMINMIFYDDAYKMCLSYAEQQNEWDDFENKLSLINELVSNEEKQYFDNNNTLFKEQKINLVAQKLLDVLKQKPQGMTRTEIYRFLNSKTPASVIEAALSILAKTKLAKKIVSKETKTNIHPTERWFVVEAQDD